MSHGVEGKSKLLLDELGGQLIHKESLTWANAHINVLLLECQILRFRSQHQSKARLILWEGKQLYKCDSEDILKEMVIKFGPYSSGWSP